MVQVSNITKCTPKSMTYFLFLLILFVIVHLWFVKYILDFADDVDSIFSITKRIGELKDTKYILLWTKAPYNFLIKDDKIIYPRINCSRNNCVFTKDKGLFDGVYTRFDAILFNEDILYSRDKPAKREPSQIYVFNTLESSYTFPACELDNDGFFNWTLTYRLDSDIVWSYFIVRNLKGAIVAPSVTVKWRRSLRPVQQKIKTILAGKRKAAAWLVSHCKADSLRDEYLSILQEQLFHFALKIDVYGQCSHRICPKGDCDLMIRKNYYFYMVFENSLSEDYVTDKVLHGYNNYAVPIVYGGANYSRFLPAGSYLNARDMHPYNLAFAMYQAITTPALYETYFRWTNLYTVTTEFRDRHPLCKLCCALHHKKVAPAKEKFREWWNGRNGFKWCEGISKEYWNVTANVNIDAKRIFNIH